MKKYQLSLRFWSRFFAGRAYPNKIGQLITNNPQTSPFQLDKKSQSPNITSRKWINLANKTNTAKNTHTYHQTIVFKCFSATYQGYNLVITRVIQVITYIYRIYIYIGYIFLLNSHNFHPEKPHLEMFRHLRSSETIHHRLSGDTTWVGKHVKEN